MFSSAWDSSRWFVISTIAALGHCSVEFFIDPEYDLCSRDQNVIACGDNTDRGGLCAYAADANMLWCCPAPAPACWGYGVSCTGGSSGAPGVGQISCSYEGTQWCCNQEYELCTQATGQSNICVTNFASANANVSIAEANAVESSSTSSSSWDATPLSTVSATLLSTVSATPLSTDSATPLSIDSATSLITVSATSLSSISATSSTILLKTTASSSLPVATSSNSPNTSKSSSSLASGAIAGIVIGVLVAVACLVGSFMFGTMRARRRKAGSGRGGEGNKAEGMPFTEEYRPPTMENDSMKPELDGRGPVTQLPWQDVRHELIS